MAALFLALPTRLLAGGPPWLAVPIDGLTPDNTKATNELLTAKLKDKLYPPEVFRGVAILEHAKQPYVDDLHQRGRRSERSSKPHSKAAASPSHATGSISSAM